MHFVYPRILHNYRFQFLLGITVVPREIENNGYAKFGGVNKVHYGLCENSEYDTCHKRILRHWLRHIQAVCLNLSYLKPTLQLL